MNIMHTCPHASVNPSRVNSLKGEKDCECDCMWIHKIPVNYTVPQKIFTVSIVVVLPKPYFYFHFSLIACIT